MPSLFNRAPKTPPQTRPLVSAPYNQVRPLTASASQIKLTSQLDLAKAKDITKRSDWQTYAWEYFDVIGQIHYASVIVSSLLSRINLFPAYIEEDRDIPTHISRSENASKELINHCRDALTLLSDAPGGISGLLRLAAMNTFVVGEFYLVKYRATAFNGEYWRIHSTQEIEFANDAVYIIPYPNAPRNLYTPVDGKFMARIWNPHPRYTEMADSSMRSVLDDCEEYTILGRSVRATGRSRLNAGLLLVPDDLSSSLPDDGETYDSADDPDVLAPYSEAETDSLEDDLINQFVEPATDDGSPASVSPLIIRGPSESLKNISHLNVNRDFDAHQLELYNSALNRILTGIDIPKDIVTGLADVKYANGVNVEDTLYTNHLEPMIMFLCDGLTSSFLKPVLRSWGHTEEELRSVALWFDASSITTKPDRTAAANFGLQNNILSAKAWRRTNGFQESDAPTPEELLKKSVLTTPPTEGIQSAILSEAVPDYAAAAQSAYEEASPDTPSGIADSLVDASDPAATTPDDSTPQDQSFDDILNSNDQGESTP